MNKKIVFILTVVLAVSLTMACVSAEGIFDFFSSADANTVNNETNLIVGFNSKFPPFGYQDDDGNYVGFDLALAKEVCDRNNWTFVPQPIIDWNTKQLELDGGEIDCIWSEFTINGRENDYTWTEPYFNNTKIIIVKSDSSISSLSDLEGKTIEIQQGSSFLNTIKNNQTLKDLLGKVNEVDGYDTALMDLESGVCDAVICDSGLGYYKITERFNNENFKVLDDTISHEEYGVAFKKGNTDLRDQVQKTLDEMFEDGTVDEIAQNYSQYKIPEGLIHP
ncbi:transporter substrate-binding domain-containing protein [Methanobrevibacter sp.]|uniref:transporter substrate-binding domain-containing protein n=1 Tax=Methanobrevibacter sp. TaxID=66852 RepID=UPI0025E5FD9F|nr:transporter substrate-binding domain-containing protein [Methanobrevibacter sp.]MBQ2666309.1 transporter substrate-binding domain-containing protein [Methanobrevibacter sp.]